jgi:uncharacterized protein (TIGR03437 family)
MRLRYRLLITLCFACAASAQTPAILPNGIVNVASYAYAGLPGGGIAPGSMFVAFGSNLGPATLVPATTFPLQTSLGGTSAKVVAGGTTYNVILNYSLASQITGILPSAVPPGSATMTVTYNGATSAPQPFTVTANSFGTFATNSGGSGPGSITSVAGKVFTATAAANPNEPAVIYGTGIGAIAGDTALDMTGVPAEVYVGTTKATVTYRGRSGCCAGIDQITLTVPSVAGLTGCSLPVVVKINNVVSNTTTIPIAPTGTRTCADVNGPPSALLDSIHAKGTGSIGAVALTRVTTSINLGSISIPGFDPNFNADIGAATFMRFTQAQLDATANPFNTQTVGACTVSYTRGGTVAATAIIPKTLDAGAAISVASSGGNQSITKSVIAGQIGYSAVFGTLGTSASYLGPGTFTITGSGGPDVGAFTAVLKNPAAVTWTNQTAITSVTRSAGQVITWSGGDATTTILIGGQSTSGNAADSVGASFQCTAKATDGTFTVPALVLLSMPPSYQVSGIDTAALYVAANTAPVTFTASGLDYGAAIGVVESVKTLGYK